MRKWFESCLFFLLFGLVVLTRSFFFDAISDDLCLDVPHIPENFTAQQRRVFCACKRRTGDYTISLDTIKKIHAGKGTPEDHARYDRIFKRSCEENALGKSLNPNSTH